MNNMETMRAEFEQFKNMFLMVGGVLCVIIALVGILNFFNAVMTEIMSKSKEFAFLHSLIMNPIELVKINGGRNES